jgi:hypothetical protein
VAHKSKLEAVQTANGGAASVAPFLALTSGVSGIISLFVIFTGLKQAWRLTGRSEIPVMGPYQTAGGTA